MPHIFLYLVYNVDFVLTTLCTLFIVDSSAVKFYACIAALFQLMHIYTLEITNSR